MGLLIHQPQGILFANQAACNFLGTSPSELVGHHFFDYIDIKQTDDLSHSLKKAFNTGEIIKQTKINLRPPEAEPKTIAVTIARLPWEGTPVVQILIQDISEQILRERQMQNIMATDSLTGAQNRRSFIEYTNELAQDQNTSRCGLILWDIDYFKNVNDTYGHQAGDMALKTIVLECEDILAKRILEERPDLPRPMLSRLGGEEFAVIIPASDIDETLAYAEKIHSRIAALAIKTFKHEFSVTISLGVVMGELSFNDIDHLLGLADKALYAAKANGRNQIVCAQESMPLPPESRRISRDTNQRKTDGTLH